MPDELGRVLQQLRQQQQQQWQRLYLATIELSNDELRVALKSPQAERRFVAAYVVGERRLPWQKELIELLQDRSDPVRQAVRRSLVILSFLTLNPEVAKADRLPKVSEIGPTKKFTPPVDFGPAPDAALPARTTAVQRWTEWWDAHGPDANKPTVTLRTEEPAKRSEADRLADALVSADAAQRPDLIARYRDGKGVVYTEALAYAIDRSSGEPRRELRDAFSIRLARMTDGTLSTYLTDAHPEIRRAAVLALALRESRQHLPTMVNLLHDPEPAVERAAYAALRRLTGHDFGPELNSTEEERVAAVGRWREWVKRAG